MQLTDPSSYLMPGEHWMWSGEPRQGIVFTGGDGFAIPFSLMWGGFAIFWETTVITSGAPLLFMLWGIPFIAIGLYMIFGRFFYDAWMRRLTAYVLTDCRVLIVRTAPFANTTSLNLRTLTNVQLTEASGGRGTIQFGDAPFGRWMTIRGWPGTRGDVPNFFQIEDARSVYAKIQSLQDGRSG